MKSKFPVHGKTQAIGGINLECLRLSSDGMAVGYYEGKATFVPGLLPGEIGQVQIVETKKNWTARKIAENYKGI